MRFGGNRVVDGVDIEVAQGEVFALIGPNGAGKTTIFNLISRIYNPTDGRIVFRDQDITAMPAHQVARLGIARTFQNIELFENATLLRNLLVGRHVHTRGNLFTDGLFTPRVKRDELRHRERVEDVIDFLDLQRYRDKPIRDLPYGVRKITEIARALCMEPSLILLDEPSSGLNPEETEDLAFWIHDIRTLRGITVLLVEHDMRLVSDVSDRVLAINSGRMLAQGTPAEVLNHPEVVRAYLGS
ncbi:MAG: ABC transporter ATP-binding protein [Burkholderiales bacterium]|jgi:branched-chain amino acid transport system ATP-binding protein